MSTTSPQPGQPRWSSKDDPGNPFTVDGFDCFGFVRSNVSTTGDAAIADSFTRLRSSDGSTLVGQLPESPIQSNGRLVYPFQGQMPDGVLKRASQMEDKWDIYLHAGRIHFCRSWTGSIVFVAEVDTRDGKLTIGSIWSPAALAPLLAVQQVDYLIKDHLFGHRVPHPLPGDLARDPMQVALYSFAQYGRNCCFATFENTLAPLKKSRPA